MKKELTILEIQEMLMNNMREFHRICMTYQINYSLMYGTLLGAVRHQGFIPWDDDIDVVMLREDYDRFLEVCWNGALGSGFCLQNLTTDLYFEYTFTRLCNKKIFSYDGSRDHLKSMHYLYIDIFPLDNIPDTEDLRRKHEDSIRFSRIMTKYKMAYTYPHTPSYKQMLKNALAFVLRTFPLEKIMTSYQRKIIKYDSSLTQYVANLSNTTGYRRIWFTKKQIRDTELLSFCGETFYAVKSWHEVLTALFQDYMKLPPKEMQTHVHRVYVKE